MTRWNFAGKTLSITAVAILAACNAGSQSELNPPAMVWQANLERPPIVPQKKSQALLYISEVFGNAVEVYSFPQLKKVAKLKHLKSPQGLCTDTNGDVWITLSGGSSGGSAVEFAHGGTTPIADLADPGYSPVECAVDPTTGNLALANISGTKQGQPGSVAVYADAQGSPTIYQAPGSMQLVEGCAYDDQGNLYADGSNGGSFVLAELPQGGTQFNDVPVSSSSGTIHHPNAVRWDGTYVVVDDAEPTQSALYQIEVTPSEGQIVDQITLQDSSQVSGFSIGALGSSDIVVAPEPNAATVPFYNYPAGGNPISGMTLSGLKGPVGSVISE